MTDPKISTHVEQVYYNPPKTLTALEVLDDRAVTAAKLCDKRRNDKKELGVSTDIDMMSYRNGQAIAFIDAKGIMERELRRLCNRFQNGQLTVEDFGVVL